VTSLELMKISVVWREDRWGEEGEVVAAFSEHESAVRLAKAKTNRASREATTAVGRRT
jgi:hypothetical protein